MDRQLLELVWRERSIARIRASNCREFLLLRGWRTIERGRYVGPYGDTVALHVKAAMKREREIVRRAIEKWLSAIGDPVFPWSYRRLSPEDLRRVAAVGGPPQGTVQHAGLTNRRISTAAAPAFTPAAVVKLRYRQMPYAERAKLLMDAYQPAARTSLARMVKTVRVARTLARDLHPEPMVRRGP